MEKDGHGASRTALVLVCLLFLGLSLFIDLPVIHQGFLFADQATYYAMAQSIAYDGDLEYTKKDLIRYYEDFNAGPMGIFLKRSKAGGGRKAVLRQKPRLSALRRSVRPGSSAPTARSSSMPSCSSSSCSWGSAISPWPIRPGLSLVRVLTFLFASVAWSLLPLDRARISSTSSSSSPLSSSGSTRSGPQSRGGNPPPETDAGPHPGRSERFLLSPASDYVGRRRRRDRRLLEAAEHRRPRARSCSGICSTGRFGKTVGSSSSASP